MPKEQTFVNTQVPLSTDVMLRQIAAKYRKSRSQIVRIALDEFIEKYNVVDIDKLPGPEGAERPILITVQKDESE